MIHRELSKGRKKMKSCELCNSLAKMYCESDQAILCWDCDSKVHGANFLVAKHSRTLLCHLCQSPTPWIGSGPKLGPTISVCHDCMSNGSCIEERKKEERSDDLDEDGDDETEDDDSDDFDEEDDGDEENQVVPWSSKPFPMVASSPTSQESSSEFCYSGAKASQSRTAAPASQDGGCCSFSQQGNMNWPNASSTFSPLTGHKSTKKQPEIL